MFSLARTFPSQFELYCILITLTKINDFIYFPVILMLCMLERYIHVNVHREKV